MRGHQRSAWTLFTVFRCPRRSGAAVQNPCDASFEPSPLASLPTVAQRVVRHQPAGKVARRAHRSHREPLDGLLNEAYHKGSCQAQGAHTSRANAITLACWLQQT